MTNPIPPRLSAALRDRYLLERELGQGGMATVYLAHDVKHDRKVALKVLRPELAAVIGAERFLGEIKTTANLQHPNILPLFDSGDADGVVFYVMPYVEGESLRERIDREKQLPIADAIQIAREVAAALDYAHRQGVIHRDIKPENVLLKDGHAVVADFGIALAVSAAGASRLTETGISLGTPHYMSPEQAAGDRELTPRSDIYSLAAMLYEMLAGDPPFQGSTAQAIFAKVLTERPPLVSQARETIPRHVALAVHQGLARLPADRFPTANAFAETLVRPGLIHTDAFPLPEDERAGPRRPATLPLSHAAVYATAVVLVAAIALAAWGWLREPTSPPAVWIPVAFAPNERVVSRPGPSVVISPDGSRLAYVGPGTPEAALWLWTLDAFRRDSIPGTVGAINPAFSPDGRSLVFTIASTGVIETVSLAGGPPRKIADSASYFGDAWGPDGYIYFARTNGIPGISRVPAAGGAPEIVTTADTARGEVDHRWLSILPNGKGMLFTAWRGSLDRTDITVVNLATKRVTVLFSGVFARYAASGHIVYAGSDHSLSAVPFDEDGLTVTGKSVPLIGSASVKHGAAADFTISANGTLAYMTGSAPVEELVWVRRDGQEEPVDARLREAFSSLRISPDGKRVAVSYPTSATENLWVYDFATAALTRLSFDGRFNRRAEWSRDGHTIMYTSDRGGSITLWRIPADGGRTPERVLPPGVHDEAQDASQSPDGRWIVYRRGPGREGNLELMVIAPGTDTVAHPFVTNPARGTSPRVSPDGRWVAYVSSESGRYEVYVRTLPASGGRWQVSLDGGTEPVWSRTGNELFYRSADNHLVAVTVATQPSFRVRERRTLFSAAPYAVDFNRSLYDVSPDGQRFLMVKVLSGTPTPPDLGGSEEQLMLVLNWFGALKQAVAAGN